MKISFQSELMENQKHAVVMTPGLAFEVLQSQDGDSLFFSIGTDNIFYLTREVTETATGWNKVDLSSALSSQHGGAAVAAKAFSVTQDTQTLAIDLALVLTVGSSDFLYLSLGNANTDAAWSDGVTWSAVPFDAGAAPSPFTIADVLLMAFPGSGGAAAVQNIFVDVLRTPGDPLKLLDRYYIAPGGSPQWNPHQLAADLAAGSISSCLGKRTNDPVPGIYTFGTIGGEPELLFTPQYNYFRPSAPPSPARLTLPPGASAIASALDTSGVSNLFVSGSGGLFLFTPGNQGDEAAPVQIASDALIAGATALTASSYGQRTAVWGLSPKGDLFYLTCPAGSEATSAAWSVPVPLVTGVEEFAFFLNLNAGNNVVFAEVSGQSLVQLTQDPVTTAWLQRSILLPSTSPDDMAVYTSYTTHIQITDDNGIGVPNVTVSVTATSPASVYLNDVYQRLSPTVAVNTTADATGTLTVIQETQSLAAVCFQVALTDTPGVVADINPMSKALGILSTIQSGDDLTNVQVTNADGTQQALVPSSVSPEARESAAQSLAQLVKISATLPQSGSCQTAPTVAAPGAGAGVVTPTSVLSISEADFQIAPGDLFAWLQNAVDDLESFVVQAAEDGYHFLATIAGKVYDAVLDSIHAVVHAVEVIFNTIAVAYEDVVKWLGFVFEWGDILNTHNALKNFLKQGAAQAIQQIATLEDDVKSAFSQIESQIDTWAGIPSAPSTIGSQLAASSGAVPGYGSPQANWALYHTKSNLSSATSSCSLPSTNLDPLAQIFDDLKVMADADLDDLTTFVQRLKTEVIDPFTTLTASEVVQRIAAIVADATLTLAENLIVASLDIIQVAIQGILDLLDTPINIPILSSLYHDISGNDLSFLDLACLIAAIPATIVYKAVAGKAPFSPAAAQALSGAQSYAAIQTLFAQSTTPATPPAMVLMAQSTTVASAPEPASETEPNTVPSLTTMTLVTGIFSAMGAVVMAILDADERYGQEADPAVLSEQMLRDDPPGPGAMPTHLPKGLVRACTYLVYTSPNFTQAFYNPSHGATIANDVFTAVGVGKNMTDSLCSDSRWKTYSPGLECVINIGGLLSVIAIALTTEDKKTSDWLAFGGGLASGLGGAVTPLSLAKTPLGTAFFVGKVLMYLCYGGLMVASGIELINDN